MNNIIFTHEAGIELKRILASIPSEDIFVLVDNNSRNYCLEYLQPGYILPKHILTIPDGEHNKSLDYVSEIWHALSKRTARRNSVLINIGGGMITDLGGFAASCFKRGIRCVNIPTTLLAQVDASIGGKTGINFDGLKNEIGTFSIPEWVIIDNHFLKTLPLPHLLSGFAEMLKHALLADEDQLAEIMQADLSRASEEEFLGLIRQSVAIKTAIVQSDPREKGLRKALNFGHTVGHAIESIAIQKGLSLYHGDAVAYGMIAELYLSVRHTGFDEKQFKSKQKFISEKYPPNHPVAEAETLYELMLHDKKNEHAGVNFTLLRRPGEFETDHYCGKEDILEALQQIQCS